MIFKPADRWPWWYSALIVAFALGTLLVAILGAIKGDVRVAVLDACAAALSLVLLYLSRAAEQ